MSTDPSIPVRNSEPTNPARWPWIAVAVDGGGEVLDIGDLSHMDQGLEASFLESVTVVRGPNVPVVRDGVRRLPEVIRREDVLYEIEDLGDEPDTIPLVWQQARAVAAAMNAAAEAEREWDALQPCPSVYPEHPGWQCERQAGHEGEHRAMRWELTWTFEQPTEIPVCRGAGVTRPTNQAGGA